MKKLLSITILAAFTASTATSQTVQKSVRPVKQNVIIKTVPGQPPPPPPAPAPPPPSTNKTSATGTQNTLVYTLTAIRVNIGTGSDNKEFPSKVGVSVWKKGTQLGDYLNNCLYYVNDLKNEMAVNSKTDIGLEKYEGSSDKFSLTNLQISGLEMRVSYDPNFFMDAWKVENISLTLEFKDQNGNYHPTMGRKTISFSNAIGFLNSEYTYFKCITDQDFNPLTASIQKR